jgi:hypothetical protein
MTDTAIVPIQEKTFEIHRPSTPKHLKITQTMQEDFLIDPVLGAEVLFKANLDAFQRARLKKTWWAPRTLDTSGFSSAKTFNLWVVSNLRCLLMPDQHAGIYYPVFSTGQQTYWQYFNKFQGVSSIFRAQIGEMDALKEKNTGKATKKGPSCWTCDYKNESKVMMPAASFIQDARTQASIRLNFLGVDEWTKIMIGGSSGIEDQLLGRVTRECFNMGHPLWCNHHVFMATAEDAVHPGYDRYLHFKKEVEKGNPDYVILIYSFKDYSDLNYKPGRSFKEVFREEKVLKDIKAAKSAAGYRQEALGIWSTTGRGWYTQPILDAAHELGTRRNFGPICGRNQDPEPENKDVHFFLGADPARAENKKADDGALVTLRARPMIEDAANVRDFQLDFVWAYKVRKADARQWSGIIHRKHSHFQFTRICMDPGGGGIWIKPELMKQKQLIREEEVDCLPIASLEDEIESMVVGQFILSMFKMKDKRIAKLWGQNQFRMPENLVDYAQSEFKEAFEIGAIGLPPKVKDRESGWSDTWSEERVWSNKLLDLCSRQLSKIAVQTNEDGSTYFNQNSARLFSGRGRKDFAYAAMFAFVAFLSWLKDGNVEMAVSEEDGEQCL